MTSSTINVIFHQFLNGFLICFLLTILLLITKNHHKSFTIDHKIGPQKIHDEDIIRIGGLPVFLSLFLACFFLTNTDKYYWLKLILIVSPTFLAGFTEDITKKINPYYRLLFSFVTAILFLIVYEVSIKYVSMEFLDFLLKMTSFSYFFTLISIVLLTQAMNIVDGLNGLCLGSSLLMSLSMLYVSININYLILIPFISLFTGCLTATLFFNFPKSKVFLGDGGAYLTGAILAFIIILLSQQSNLISPFYFFLLVLYPVYETVRSFCRRVFTNKKLGFEPDQKHLHSLVFQVIKRKYRNYKANAYSSLLILIFQLVYVTIGCFFFNNEKFLIITIFVFILNYELIYFRLGRSY